MKPTKKTRQKAWDGRKRIRGLGKIEFKGFGIWRKTVFPSTLGGGLYCLDIHRFGVLMFGFALTPGDVLPGFAGIYYARG